MFTSRIALMILFIARGTLSAADLPDTILFQDINNQLINFPTRRLETAEQAECFKKAPLFSNIAYAEQPIYLPISGQSFNNFINFCKRHSEGFPNAIQDVFQDVDHGITVLTALDFPLDELVAKDPIASQAKKRKAQSEVETLPTTKQARTEYKQKTSFTFRDGNLILNFYDDLSEYIRSIKTATNESIPKIMADDFETTQGQPPKDLEIPVDMSIQTQTVQFLEKYVSFLSSQKDQAINDVKVASDYTIIQLLSSYPGKLQQQILREAIFFAHYFSLIQIEDLLERILFYQKAKNLLNKLMTTDIDYSLKDNINQLIPHDEKDVLEVVRTLKVASRLIENENIRKVIKYAHKVEFEIGQNLKKYNLLNLLQTAVRYNSSNDWKKFVDEVNKKVANTQYIEPQLIIEIFNQELEISRKYNFKEQEKRLFTFFALETDPYIVIISIILQCKNSSTQNINFPFVEYSLRKLIPQPIPYSQLKSLLDTILKLLQQYNCNSDDIKILKRNLCLTTSKLSTQSRALICYYPFKTIQEIAQEEKIISVSLENIVNDSNRLSKNKQLIPILMGKYTQDF